MGLRVFYFGPEVPDTRAPWRVSSGMFVKVFLSIFSGSLDKHNERLHNMEISAWCVNGSREISLSILAVEEHLVFNTNDESRCLVLLSLAPFHL